MPTKQRKSMAAKSGTAVRRALRIILGGETEETRKKLKLQRLLVQFITSPAMSPGCWRAI
uniref:Uncharacterized protein n=1 Tax=Candidozyma auris TaxID=498019 RepID=A0A0L0P6E4_CANAR